MELHYWNLRGLGEAARLMLEYLGADFKNTHPKSFDAWKEAKYTCGVDYPNLPYLVDGDRKITQSCAIMRYLARKFKKLGGETEDEIIAVDRAEGFACDFRMGLIRVWFGPDYENSKEAYFKNLATSLKSLEEFLGKNKWSAGDKLTYVDFIICESLDHHEMMVPGCLSCSPNVQKYYQAFEALPQIVSYKKSGRFQKWPVSGGSAKWGNDNN